MLASSDPVHVTARSMVAHKNSGTATYSGKARLWQNANVIEAPTIQFQKEPRMLVANSDSSQKVSTVIVGTGKDGRTTPVSISSNQLTYRDPERKAQFEGAVIAHSADLTITARHMDVLLASGNANSSPSATNAPSKLERIVASGSVVITEPKRRATGEQLTYTAADDKFVLVGGPPSIFDAEHGKITGVSLTLFRRDGRVVVEGNSSSPAITETRVVR
jgi:lipopolysaccharide export system protein LptA